MQAGRSVLFVKISPHAASLGSPGSSQTQLPPPGWCNHPPQRDGALGHGTQMGEPRAGMAGRGGSPPRGAVLEMSRDLGRRKRTQAWGTYS